MKSGCPKCAASHHNIVVRASGGRTCVRCRHSWGLAPPSPEPEPVVDSPLPDFAPVVGAFVDLAVGSDPAPDFTGGGGDFGGGGSSGEW